MYLNEENLADQKTDHELLHDGDHFQDHVHEDGHTHVHVHDPEEKKRQINRLSRIIGHLEYVKKMLIADKDCADVLIQISAAKSALNGLGKEIIKEHTTHCIAHAIEDGDMDEIQEFFTAMQKYLDV